MLPLSSISTTLPIQSLGAVPGVGGPERIAGVQTPLASEPASAADAGQATGDSFANVLGRMVQEVNTKQNVASDAMASLQSGQGASLHQTVIAVEEASVSFQLMVEVRNRLLDSYQEIMRMQV